MTAENRSEWAVMTAALAAPLLLWCTGASWLWTLGGALTAVGIYGFICFLQTESDLTALTQVAFGKPLGRAILWLQVAALALGAGYLLRRAGGIVPNLSNGYPWITAVLCILALAGAWRGRKAALAGGAVLFWLPVLTIVVVTVFSLPQVRLQWVRPEGTAQQFLPAIAVFLLPVTALYCRAPAQKGKGAMRQLLLALAGTLIVFLTSACISPRLAAQQPLPFFTLAASCRLLGHAARFDAVLSMAVAAALYCLLLTLLCVCHQLSPGKKWPLVIFLVLVLIGSVVAAWIPAEWIGAYIVVSWGIQPISTAFIGCAKKAGKSGKRC